MNALDVIFSILLSIFILVGVWKGFFKQIFALIGIAAGIFFAIIGFGPLSKVLTQVIPSLPSFIWLILSFLVIFVAIYISCQLLAGLFSKLSQLFLLGWLNRLLGGIIGGIKGITLMSLFLLIVGFLPFQRTLHDVRKDSLMYEPIQRFIPTVYNLVTGFSFNSRDLENKIIEILKDVQGKLDSEMMKYFLYGD
jgi:membrane protein required for colicin V production